MKEEHTNKIELTDEMGMIMTYPTLDSFTGDTTVVNATNMLDIIANCVAQIYDKKGEDVYDSKDSTHKELVDFIEQLNSKQFAEVQKFFDTNLGILGELSSRVNRAKLRTESIPNYQQVR